jgi:hypothetical protein
MRDWTDTALKVATNLCIGLALMILYTLPFIVACWEVPGLEPTPSPSPSPTAVPTPTPTPVAGGDILQGVEWALVSPRPPARFTEDINAAMGALTACAPQSRCVVVEPMKVYLNRVAVELRTMGLYAGIQPGADEVCVGTKPSECQGYHAYVCSVDCNKGTVGWAPGSVRDTWHALSLPNPEPTPPPQLGWNPPPPRGVVIVKSVGVNRPVIDATPKTVGQPVWCNAWSTGGNNCPGGGEGNPTQRQAVEAIWGPWVWTIEGADCIASGACFLDGGNPLRIVAPGSKGKRIRVTGGNGVFGEMVP